MRRLMTGVGIVMMMVVAGPPALAGGGGCATVSEGDGPKVAIRNNCFEATVTHVEVGDEVTWVNEDSWTHNLVSPAFRGTEAVGGGFTTSFDSAGIYPFACTLHHGMVGAIVVGLDTPAAADLRTVPADETTSSQSTVLAGATLLVVTGVLIGRSRPFSRRASGASQPER